MCGYVSGDGELRSLRGIMPERDDGEHKFMSENG